MTTQFQNVNSTTEIVTATDIGSAVQAYDADLADIAGLTRTKGDLIVGSATAWTDLAVGTNGHVLTADSTQATGVKWAASTGGSSDNRTVPMWVSGNWHQATLGSEGGSWGHAAMSSNVANSCAAFILQPVAAGPSITGIAVGVQTASNAASPTARLMLFAPGTGGLPGNLLVDGGTVSINSSGSKSVTFSAVANSHPFLWFGISLIGHSSATTDATFWRVSTPANFGPDSFPIGTTLATMGNNHGIRLWIVSISADAHSSAAPSSVTGGSPSFGSGYQVALKAE